jgi:hypothetical protein
MKSGRDTESRGCEGTHGNHGKPSSRRLAGFLLAFSSLLAWLLFDLKDGSSIFLLKVGKKKVHSAIWFIPEGSKHSSYSVLLYIAVGSGIILQAGRSRV